MRVNTPERPVKQNLREATMTPLHAQVDATAALNAIWEAGHWLALGNIVTSGIGGGLRMATVAFIKRSMSKYA